jgi:TatD DNase family protein
VKSPITDSHCHLGSHKFSPEEIPEIVARATEAGVHRMITLSTEESDIQTNLNIAEAHSEVSACIGIHPCDVHTTREDFETLLTSHLENSKVAAIGETGLDYFHPAPDGWTEDDYHKRQRDFLRRHFELAKSAGLNIVIHTRDRKGNGSFDDALEIYADYSTEVRAVFHCFPGPPELAERVIKAGGIVSFTGIATFKNAHAVVDTVKAVPDGSFMVETDSPYLSPTPHRGKRCEPAFTRFTAEAIAKHRNLPFEHLAAMTEEVVNDFFRFPAGSTD